MTAIYWFSIESKIINHSTLNEEGHISQASTIGTLILVSPLFSLYIIIIVLCLPSYPFHFTRQAAEAVAMKSETIMSCLHGSSRHSVRRTTTVRRLLILLAFSTIPAELNNSRTEVFQRAPCGWLDGWRYSFPSLVCRLVILVDCKLKHRVDNLFVSCSE